MAPASQPPGLIDTDILIDVERGVPDAVAFFRDQLAAGGSWISIISSMELIVGCRNNVELANVQQFLGLVTELLITASGSLHARQLMEAHRLSHGLAIADALIAATALEHDFVLYTKNIRHFSMIPDLTVVRPY